MKTKKAYKFPFILVKQYNILKQIKINNSLKSSPLLLFFFGSCKENVQNGYEDIFIYFIYFKIQFQCQEVGFQSASEPQVT